MLQYLQLTLTLEGNQEQILFRLTYLIMSTTGKTQSAFPCFQKFQFTVNKQISDQI